MIGSEYIYCTARGKREDCELVYQIPGIDVKTCYEDCIRSLEILEALENDDNEIALDYYVIFSPKEMGYDEFINFLYTNKIWLAKLTCKHVYIDHFYNGFCDLEYTPKFLALLGEMNFYLHITCREVPF